MLQDQVPEEMLNTSGYFRCTCGRLSWGSGKEYLNIQGATDGQAATVEDVGVDHGGLDALVAEQFLDGMDIIA
jgi:hypothetical protein